MSIWGDAIPVALPELEYYVIYRKQYASARLMIRRPDALLITREQIIPLLNQYPEREQNLKYRLLNYPKPPAEMVRFIRSFPYNPQKLEFINPGVILDRELVEKYAY